MCGYESVPDIWTWIVDITNDMNEGHPACNTLQQSVIFKYSYVWIWISRSEKTSVSTLRDWFLQPIYLRHDSSVSFIRVTWLIQANDQHPPFICMYMYIYIWTDSISLSMWDMTHLWDSYVWRDSFTRMTCTLSSYECMYTYIVFICMYMYIYIDLFHQPVHVGHDSYMTCIRVTWLIHTNDLRPPILCISVYIYSSTDSISLSIWNMTHLWHSYVWMIYIHIFIYSYSYSYSYSYIHIFIYSYVHTFIYSYFYLFIYSYIHIFICSYVHIFIYSYIHIFICSYIHIFIYHMFICSYSYWYMHLFICVDMSKSRHMHERVIYLISCRDVSSWHIKLEVCHELTSIII